METGSEKERRERERLSYILLYIFVCFHMYMSLCECLQSLEVFQFH